MGVTLERLERAICATRVRTLRRTPGFTATVVGTLGLAIGVDRRRCSPSSTACCSIPLPYRHPERLVFVAGTAPGSDMPGEFGVAGEFFLQYKETLAAARGRRGLRHLHHHAAGRRPRRARSGWRSPPTRCTRRSARSPRSGGCPWPRTSRGVVVISDALWRSWFGADPSVVGRAYDIAGREPDGDRRDAAGVPLPERRRAAVDRRATIRAEGLRPGRFGYRWSARMAPGATREAAAAELTALARRLPERFGGSPAYARIIEQHRAVVRPLLDEMLGPAARVAVGAVRGGRDRAR